MTAHPWMFVVLGWCVWMGTYLVGHWIGAREERERCLAICEDIHRATNGGGVLAAWARIRDDMPEDRRR